MSSDLAKTSRIAHGRLVGPSHRTGRQPFADGLVLTRTSGTGFAARASIFHNYYWLAV